MNRTIHAVGIIVENEVGQVLVLKRNKQDPEGETWGLVGGKIDEGEDKYQATTREVKEEIGYELDSSKLQFLKTYHWDRDDIDLIFEVFQILIPRNEIKIKLDKRENTEHLWSKPKDLVQQKDLMTGLYPILKDTYQI